MCTRLKTWKKSYSPLALRELCLRTHYRKTMNFTFDALDAAQTNVKKLNEFKRELRRSRSQKMQMKQ